MDTNLTYIYGAGVFGQKAIDLIDSQYSSFAISGFIDRNKTGELCGRTICRIEEVDGDPIIIIAIEKFDTAVSIYKNLHKLGFVRIFWFYKEKKVIGKTFIEEQCIDCSGWAEGGAIAQVEMHIMDACNLNCRGCAHFSPIFNKDIPDFESRINDVKQLSQKFAYIHQFYILGGEPFLNPEIGKYVEYIRSILPESDLIIVTNGLLILKADDSILEKIRENDVMISISEYRPVHNVIEKIKEILERHGIEYEIRTMSHKTVFNRPLSISADSKYEKLCISNKCVTIWNGKISRCPTLMYIDRFNEEFGQKLPNQGTLVLKDAPNGWELVEYLQKQVPLCDYCVKYPIDWSVCGNPPDLEDFASLD